MKTILDREAGEEQKSLGLFAAELNNTEFVRLARQVAKLISQQTGSVSMDQVRTHPALKGWQPSSPNVYGAIIRGKGWVFLCWEPSRVTSNHARRIGRYRWQP